jgi:hypothetical protein
MPKRRNYEDLGDFDMPEELVDLVEKKIREADQQLDSDRKADASGK